jgi:hypothetical protein
MGDIYESDTIPTDRDISVAKQIFTNDNDEYDAEKVAFETARLRRRELMQSSATKEVLVCLKGDEMGQHHGVIQEQKCQGALIKEMHEMMKKGVTTATYKKKPENSGVSKIVYMLLGGVVLLGFMITTIIAIIGLF